MANTKNKVYKSDTENLTHEEYEQVVREMYMKPTPEELVKNFESIARGGVKKRIINKEYIDRWRFDTVVRGCPYSVNEVLADYDLMNYALRYRKKNLKLYPPTSSARQHLEGAFGTCGAGFCRIATQYPLKSVRAILEKYNVNNNYYDYSCGWGDRLCGALSMNINYFGTDPNTGLAADLRRLADDYRCAIADCTSNVEIRSHGSEEFVPEWAGRMGVCFSSPPYFNLEDYRNGNQSYKTGETTYEQWLNEFILPTILNCKEYLCDGGYFIINVKNFDKFNLEDDVRNIAESVGLKFVCNETLQQMSKRVKVDNKQYNETVFVDSSEKIQVFRKV